MGRKRSLVVRFVNSSGSGKTRFRQRARTAESTALDRRGAALRTDPIEALSPLNSPIELPMAAHAPVSTPPSQTSPLRRFSESQALARLALLVDALPLYCREALLQACLGFSPSEILTSSDLVTACRSLLLQCVAERLAVGVNVRWIRRIDPSALTTYVAPVVAAQDPAQTALALCDLVQVLVDSVTAFSRPRIAATATGSPRS